MASPSRVLPAMLTVQLTQRRREFVVEVDFTVAPGGALALFGVSGAGKSTVLSAVAGLAHPDAGRIEFGGERWFPPPRPPHRRRVGYLTQAAGLFPHLTVEQNVRFGRPLTPPGPDPEAWAGQLRAHLGLDAVWRARPAQLSGGQARRVALARTLFRRPPLVLFDEPFAGLDRDAVRGLIEAIGHWRAELGFTMLLADHQPEVLARLCPEVLVLEAGRTVQRDRWEAVREAPATPTLRRLLEPW